MKNNIFKAEFFSKLGFALIILAICLGIGKCCQLCDSDIQKEKTKQLKLQVELYKMKKEINNEKNSKRN